MVTSTISQYDSSTLKSGAYNFKHKTLVVQFKHTSYLYKDVSELDWNLFNTAKSQGIALNAYIKDKYEFEKINEDQEVLSTPSVADTPDPSGKKRFKNSL